MDVVKKQNKKILIYYASVGSGHKFAALPLQKILISILDKNFSVELIDALDFFKGSFRTTFRTSQKKLSGFIGKIYDYLWKSKIFIPSEEKLNGLILPFSTTFEKHLLDINPRVVVSVHGLPAILISYLKKKNLLLKTIHIVVNTDFRPHTYWPVSGVDLYVVASELGKEDLIKMGVSSSKIKVLGIPIRSQFSEVSPKSEILKQKFTKSELPVVLFLAGSLQKGLYGHIIKKLYKILDTIDKDFNFLLFVVTGSDAELKKELEKYIAQKKIKNVKIFGFVERMNELLNVSDLLITKPGGLICSEALAVGLPMLFLGPNFGQERANAKYFVGENIAVKLRKNENISQKIKELLSNPEKLSQMAKKAKALAKPKAAENIADLIKQFI